MKYVIPILFYFVSMQMALSVDSIAVHRIDDALINHDQLLERRIDSLLIGIQQSPREEYKQTLAEISSSIFNEHPDYTLQKLCIKALMSYNDHWSYDCISSEIDRSKNYSSVIKSFFDAYEEIENPMYKSLKQKFEVPMFIKDSYLLNESGFDDFVEQWSIYSSSIIEKNKNHPINKKIQDFYRWMERRGYDTYMNNCSERDSLYNLSKRKYRNKISILDDQIKRYIDGIENYECILPRTIDVLYSSDSFVRLKNTNELDPIIPGSCLRCSVDSQVVVVPYLTDFNSKRSPQGETHIFLMDTYIKNLLGKYAEKSERNHEKICNLFNVSISIRNNHVYLYPYSYPIITRICSYSDGVLFNVMNVSSGYCVFFPNEDNSPIETFGEWIE